MDEDRAGRHAVPYWVDKAQTAKLVTLLQALHEPVAQHTNRPLFEPARARCRPDNDHLRPMRLLQAIAECGGDASGMEVATLTHQGIEERTELVGVSAGRLIGPQPRP